MSEVELLREEVKRRQRAASQKMSRMKRVHGVEVRGSAFDVRRDTAKVARYNSRQLRSYLNELNEFTSRKTVFLAGAKGQPLPKQKFEMLKRLEAKYNERVKREMSAVAGVKLPNKGMTVAEREATLKPNTIRAAGPAVNRPYSISDRPAHRINGAEALDTFIRDMRRKNSRDYLPHELNESRRQMGEMLKRTGNLSYLESLNALTNDQFDTLWNWSNFADDLSFRYEMVKKAAAGEKDSSYDQTLEDNNDDIQDMLNWAHSLPKRKQRNT